jgi:hypothetical protein
VKLLPIGWQNNALGAFIKKDEERECYCKAFSEKIENYFLLTVHLFSFDNKKI